MSFLALKLTQLFSLSINVYCHLADVARSIMHLPSTHSSSLSHRPTASQESQSYFYNFFFMWRFFKTNIVYLTNIKLIRFYFKYVVNKYENEIVKVYLRHL